jgi:hypothetical protein
MIQKQRNLWTQCLIMCTMAMLAPGHAAHGLLVSHSWHASPHAQESNSCAMAHGIEPRSPVMGILRMIKFALNLPWHYRVGTTAKPIIRQQFLQNWSADLIYPKQGFTGHCNDSYNWLDIDITRSQDRMQDWKNISQAGFTRWCN